MAGVEDRCETYPGLEGLYHNAMHFVINDMACDAEVDGIDHFIISVFFIAVKILGLSAVTRVMEEQ